jgi:hypothetical protein
VEMLAGGWVGGWGRVLIPPFPYSVGESLVIEHIFE